MSGNDTAGVSLNGNNGAAFSFKGISAKAFATSVWVGAALFVLQFSLFQLFKALPRLKDIYQPRTYLVPEKQRVRPPPNNPALWLLEIFKLPSKTIIEKSGLDAYFFIRYLQLLLKVFVPLGIFILPILLPLNYSGGVGTSTVVVAGQNKTFNVTGLDTLSFTNVSPAKTDRYWAHLVLALLVVTWCCYLFYDELLSSIRTRQEYITSPQHRLKASANTVLVTGIPPELCNLKALDELYDVFPGGIRKIWLNRNYDTLQQKVSRRDKLVRRLEDAETMLIRNANKKHEKQLKKGGKSVGKKPALSGTATSADDTRATSEDHIIRPSSEDTKATDASPMERSSVDGIEEIDEGKAHDEYLNDSDGAALWQKYLKKGNRSTMWIFRFGWTFWTSVSPWWIIFLPLTKPVDTIYYCREEIDKSNREIEECRKDVDAAPPLNSAFIQFNQQIAAHMCCQCVSHHQLRQMAPRIVEVSPHDVVWANLSLKWWERYLRWIAVFLIFVGMLVLWGVLVSITGFLSNIDSVANQVSWLHWINSLDKTVVALIKGPLPALIIQGLLTGLVPILLRLLTRLEGVQTGTIGEKHLQNYYFAFLFIELFLVASISSGITQVIPKIIQQPTLIPSILAKNLPKAANYFFNYMIIQSLSISATNLFQVWSLVARLWRKMFTPTPRQRFMRQISLDQQRWGSFYPFYTTIAVIGMVYCVIAPLVIIFVVITFSLFWVVFRNQNMYVTKNRTETGGLLYLTAVNQLFSGLYVMEIALIGLFFLVQDTQGDLACKAQAIIIIVALIATVVFQVNVNLSISELTKYMPITLDDDAVARDKDFEQALLERHHLNTVEATSSTDKKLDDGTTAPVEPSKFKTKSKLNGNSTKLQRTQKYFSRTEQEARLWQDPIAEILAAHHDELEDLLPEDRKELVEIAFTNPAVRERPRIAWIPQDELGVSNDELKRTMRYSKKVPVENDGAFLSGKKLKVAIDRMPPDLSEYYFVEPEL